MTPAPRVDTQTVLAMSVGEVGVLIAATEHLREHLIDTGEWDRTRPPGRDLSTARAKLKDALSGLQDGM